MSILDSLNLKDYSTKLGSSHPINQTKDYILDLLLNIGFEEVHGPEIETEKFNFDMLNIKKHILRDKCMILSHRFKNKRFANPYLTCSNKKHA